MSDETLNCCSNCNIQIPESKLMLHEMYCQRNVKKCERCNNLYDVNEIELHEEEFHAKIKCKYCQLKYEEDQIQKHQLLCPQKPKMCIFCSSEFSPNYIMEHEKQCGSRIKICEQCKKQIITKDFAWHETQCEQEKVIPSIPQTFNKPSIQQKQVIRPSSKDIISQQNMQIIRLQYNQSVQQKQSNQVKQNNLQDIQKYSDNQKITQQGMQERPNSRHLSASGMQQQTSIIILIKIKIRYFLKSKTTIQTKFWVPRAIVKNKLFWTNS